MGHEQGAIPSPPLWGGRGRGRDAALNPLVAAAFRARRRGTGRRRSRRGVPAPGLPRQALDPPPTL
ncbi:hypothetical protein ACP70R_040285 [Stipagrostis hirtigluma subsp. patula]